MATKSSSPAALKFPNSAALFQFCRRVLDHKLGGIRVIDQDVGQILSFDPADCSHWKKGKKNIRSIQAMKAIATHLGVDEKLVIDVASGDLDDTEGYFEFLGYGKNSIDPKLYDAAKKEFYKKNAALWNKDIEQELRQLFKIDHQLIGKLVKEIHDHVDFQEAPLYLPEIIGAYDDLDLIVKKSDDPTTIKIESKQEKGKTTITYVGQDEMKPFARFRIAKKIAQHFLAKSNDMFLIKPVFQDISSYISYSIDTQFNIFTAQLLTPEHMVRAELEKVDMSLDVVSQLSEVFWVSRKFMNARLIEILRA